MTENRTDRLARLFDGLRKKGEGAFVPFVNLCDPDAATSEVVIEALIAGGADALELGIPFSDPCADGPVIQASAVRALAYGATTAGCFEVLARIRAKHPDIPVGLLVYINLVTAPGVTTFFRKAAEAGADAVLIADLPVAMREAEPEWDQAAQEAGLHLIAIAPPELDDARAEAVAQRSTGYVYLLGRADYVSVTDNEALAAFVELSRREGIIPALESSHALAYALKLARANPEKEQNLIVNLSGRGDKDIFTVSRILEEKGLFTEGRLDADAARKLTDCEGGRHD